MIKKFTITGLDCPNCAKSLETSLAKIKGVKSVKIEFLKQILTVESDNLNAVIPKVKKLTKSLEPNSSLTEIEDINNESLENKTCNITCESCNLDVKNESSKVEVDYKKNVKKYKKFKLDIQGLKCPNCAKALENELNKIENVKKVSINFVKNSLTFETDNYSTSYQKIVAITHNLEPQVSLKEATKTSAKKTFFIDLSVLIFGIILGVCALFIPQPIWSGWVLYVLSALIIGYKTYIKAIKLLFKGIVNENLLVTISVIGATIVGDHMSHGGMGGHAEGLMVITLYTIGKIIEGLALNKSRNSIAELTNLKPDYAVLLVNEEEKRVAPQQVQIGDVIIVRAGERVAVDGIVIEGSATLDKQSLTGESLPSVVKEQNEILSGSIVLDGVLKIRTTQRYEGSTVSRILNLIENASDKKSKTETVISKVARYYTLAVMCLAVIVFGIEYLVLKDLSTAIYRGLIFLVVSCPCAFAISVPLTYFSGLGNASKKGILIKGSNYLDVCAKLNTIAFDKTGTLTTGKFEVEKIESLNKNLSEDDILYLSALGEQNSLHPLAKSIVEKNTKKLVKVSAVKEIAGEGVYFEYKTEKYFVGRKGKTDKQNTIVELFKGNTKLGIIYLKDAIKQTSKTLSKDLEALGVKSVLLSGDNNKIVSSVAKELNINDYYAELLPQDKFNYLEKVKQNKLTKLGFVGDGINDSPSLMLADVGISMGLNGSTASIEASNIVLVDDNPQKVVTAIKVSRYTRKIVWQNILLSAGIKVLFLTLGALGVTGMMWAVIADVGVTLLAILNSLRALKYKAK